jgi:hypothetical protein
MTFDPFGDFDTAGYLRNSLQLKDPTEVKESEHLSFELSIEDALSYLAQKSQSTTGPCSRSTKSCSPVFIPGLAKTATNLYLTSPSSRVHATIPGTPFSSTRTPSRCLSRNRPPSRPLSA